MGKDRKRKPLKKGLNTKALHDDLGTQSKPRGKATSEIVGPSLGILGVAIDIAGMATGALGLLVPVMLVIALLAGILAARNTAGWQKLVYWSFVVVIALFACRSTYLFFLPHSNAESTIDGIAIHIRLPKDDLVFPIELELQSGNGELRSVKFSAEIVDLTYVNDGMRYENNFVEPQTKSVEALIPGQQLIVSIPPWVRPAPVSRATVKARASFSITGEPGRSFVEGLFRLGGTSRDRRWDLISALKSGKE